MKNNKKNKKMRGKRKMYKVILKNKKAFAFSDLSDALEYAKKNHAENVEDVENNKIIKLKEYHFLEYYTLYKVIKVNNKVIDIKNIYGNSNILKIANILKLSIRTLERFIKKDIDNLENIESNFIIVKDYQIIL
nr:MAG TPA: hypothetical protein [Caudoviricetes sp.]